MSLETKMVKSSSSSSSCCQKQLGLRKGPWTPEEDEKLVSYIQQHGHGSWSSLPAKAGLKRHGKSCRLRWNNYLRPDIKRGSFSSQEDDTIIQLHALLGNRWSVIAHHLPRRTDNEIKNHWNTRLKKRLTRMGINPNTHKPLNAAVNGHSKDAADLSHMAQWETARLEAEARQVKEYCKLQHLQNQLGSSSSSSWPSLTRLVLNRITPRPSPPPPPPPCLDVLSALQNSWSPTSADQNRNTPMMYSMYAMMLTAVESPGSSLTLSFPDNTTAPPNSQSSNSNTSFGLMTQSSLPSSAVVNDTGPWGSKAQGLGDEGNIMAGVEAFRSSTTYSCNNDDDIEDLHNEDVVEYGFNEMSRDDWEDILDLVNGFPPVFPVL